MLVDVVELRRQGERLPAAAVKASRPIRGILSLSSGAPGWHPGQRSPPLTAALVSEDRLEGLLQPLRRAHVAKIARGALLIVGIQQVVRPIRVYEQVPQAWWVRPCAGGTPG